MNVRQRQRGQWIKTRHRRVLRAASSQSGLPGPRRAPALLHRAGPGEAVHGGQDGGEEVLGGGLQGSAAPLDQQQGVSQNWERRECKKSTTVRK